MLRSKNGAEMKKFYALFIMVLFSVAFVLFACADKTFSLSVSEESALAGEEVTLTISVKNSTGISGLQFYIDYDSSALSLVSGTVDKAFSFSSPVKNENKPVTFAMATMLTDITGDFDVATVTFKVLDDAKPGKYDITLTLEEALDSKIENVDVVCNNGSVTVIQ